MKHLRPAHIEKIRGGRDRVESLSLEFAEAQITHLPTLFAFDTNQPARSPLRSSEAQVLVAMVAFVEKYNRLPHYDDMTEGLPDAKWSSIILALKQGKDGPSPTKFLTRHGLKLVIERVPAPEPTDIPAPAA